ncbi:MAG: 30S ribosomal protein S14 [Legionellaceae bacterium]
MSKKCMKEREKKRTLLCEKYSEKRKIYKEILANPNATYIEKTTARLALQKLPRDSSKTRLRNRCAITGRPRGNYRKTSLCRNKFREHAMTGDIPGLVKASW